MIHTLVHKPGLWQPTYDPPWYTQPRYFVAGDDYSGDGYIPDMTVGAIYFHGPPGDVAWEGTDFYPDGFNPEWVISQKVFVEWENGSVHPTNWSLGGITYGGYWGIDDPIEGPTSDAGYRHLFGAGYYAHEWTLPPGTVFNVSAFIGFYWNYGGDIDIVCYRWWMETVYDDGTAEPGTPRGVRIHPRNDGRGPSRTRRTYPPTPARTYAHIP